MNEALIHIAKYYPPFRGAKYLFLRERSPTHYIWYEENDDAEMETEVEAPSIEEALKEARKTWKIDAFRTVNCGFRYTLPERDEHGMNALFYQMARSMSSPNGIYLDEELGHHCFVQFASDEAIEIWKRQ